MKIHIESRLKEIMDERGIKQSHFVKKYKMSATTMSAIYREESVPTLAYASIIAQELGLRVEDIWTVTLDKKGSY